MRPRKTKRPGGPPSVVLDVGQLADEHRAVIEKTLLEGGTVEDAAEMVRAGGGPEIEAEAVARFFDGRGDLQKERARRLIAAMEEVEEGGKNGGETGKQLLRAAIMAGLMRTRRGMSRMTLREAVNAGIHKENLKLKQELLEIRVKKEQRDELLNTQYVNREIQRTKLLRLQILQLQKMMDEEKPDLKPNLMDKIHEIYGLASSDDPKAVTSDK